MNAGLNNDLISLVLESLPVGVWIMNSEGHIIYGNSEGQRIWGGALYVGIENFGEYKGWWAETGKLIESEEWAAARAVLKGEKSVNELVVIEAFDGSRKTILNSAIPLNDNNGDIVGAIIVNQDITDKRKLEAERENLIKKLEMALNQVKKLTGLLPICSGCKKIRDDENNWQPVEEFIQDRTDAEFSHGMCPECLKIYFPGRDS